jgi:hypothetical protein
MKNIIESFAVLLVGILSFVIIFLIIQYNMIKDDYIDENFKYVVPAKKKQETTQEYLSDMEKYSDVDVEDVDPSKEDTTNSVVVKSELADDNLKEAVVDKSKESYTENLEHYDQTKEDKSSHTIESKVETDNTEVVPEDNPSMDDIKNALDDIINGNDNTPEISAGIDDIRNAVDSIVDDTSEEKTSNTDTNNDDEIRMKIDAVLEDL